MTAQLGIQACWEKEDSQLHMHSEISGKPNIEFLSVSCMLYV